MTELTAAKESGDLAAIRRLVNADPECVNRRDAAGLPCLYTAALHGQDAAVDCLLDLGANIDIFACGYLDRSDVAKSLLEDAPHIANECLPTGQTALHFACRRRADTVARLLIEYGADVNATDSQGCSPLSEAAHGGPWKPTAHEGIIALLRSGGAVVDQWLAAAIGDVESLKAELNRHSVDAVDVNGATALHHAAQNDRNLCVRLLIEHGADVRLSDRNGNTALHVAALHLLSQQCSPELCQELIAAGANFDIHTAAALGDTERIQQLISTDRGTLASRRNGMPPTHYAAHCGRAAALRTLLDAGAATESVDDFGATLESKVQHLPSLRRVLSAARQ